MSRTFSVKCHFRGNELAHGEETCQNWLTGSTTRCHVIDWDQVKVLGHKSDRKTRWIKEAIEIHKSKDKCTNRDTGSYFLSTSFDKFLLREPAHFHGNDTLRRKFDSFSVLRKDAETSAFKQ